MKLKARKTMNTEKYIELIQKVYPEAASLRCHLHENPELSGKEHETLSFIESYLKELEISYSTYSNGGICACVGKGERAIGIRADVDALPVLEKTGLPFASKNDGVMHACGHDIHTAVLMGLAKVFKSIENELDCVLKLFFQPNEEVAGGAEIMVKEGCMENPKVDYTLAIHVDPTADLGTVILTPGKMNAAIIDLTVRLKGRSCHGAHPEQGADAIVAASHVICALQTVDSRMTAPTTPVVVTIGAIQGGTGNNIVAGEVTMRGTVRVLDMETARFVKEKITNIITSVASAWDVEAEVELTDNYPALINDYEATMLVADTARSVLGEHNVIMNDVPSMGGDDFAYFANASKGCYFNVGTAKEGEAIEALHSCTFAPDERCILTAMTVLGASVLNIMEKKL